MLRRVTIAVLLFAFASAQSSLEPSNTEFGLWSDVASPNSFNIHYKKPPGCETSHVSFLVMGPENQPAPRFSVSKGGRNPADGEDIHVRVDIRRVGVYSVVMTHWCQNSGTVIIERFPIIASMGEFRAFVLNVLTVLGVFAFIMVLVS